MRYLKFARSAMGYLKRYRAEALSLSFVLFGCLLAVRAGAVFAERLAFEGWFLLATASVVTLSSAVILYLLGGMREIGRTKRLMDDHLKLLREHNKLLRDHLDLLILLKKTKQDRAKTRP